MRSDLLLVFSRNEHNIKLSLIRSSFRIHFFCELFQFGAVDRAEFLQSDDRGRVARLDFHVIFQGCGVGVNSVCFGFRIDFWIGTSFPLCIRGTQV